MTKIAMLPLKEIPSSCSECTLSIDYGDTQSCCGYNLNISRYMYPKHKEDKNKRHPNCPLIEISIDELEEVVEILETSTTMNEHIYKAHLNTIKSTIDKLGGKQ